ncbi:low temperature requirement protein A [Deinococcus sp. Arct2-2]|uniref:low temperature requirement protein A n=1 Tax=Deinococcus sp. Arct2-2 TaxID=2568653 RepID=UPI0010A3217A|nr:low temperature requirement protein A [Deinococcus sp. Arct2-2]
MTTPSLVPVTLITEAPVQRVGTIELFFDLVFVFALTQLTSLVTHPHGPADYGKALLVFMTLIWIYNGYLWLGGNIELGGESRRRLTFAAMAGFFIMALSIPTVFDAGGLPYALGLLTVTTIHVLLFRTSKNSSARAIWLVAPYNFGAVVFVLAAAFVHPPYDWPLWVAAVATLMFSSVQTRQYGFQLSPGILRSGKACCSSLRWEKASWRWAVGRANWP